MKTLTKTLTIVVLMFVNTGGNVYGHKKHDDNPGKRTKIHIQFAAVI